jgi:hypothetical protein
MFPSFHRVDVAAIFGDLLDTLVVLGRDFLGRSEVSRGGNKRVSIGIRHA